MIKPIFAFIPSAFKAGKVYSILPEDGSGDLTFTRNTASTRINSSGILETVGVNVPRIDYGTGSCPTFSISSAITNEILNSEDFTTNEFVKVNSTVTANLYSAPDNTQSADQLEVTSVNGGMIKSNALGRNYDQVSIFAKYISGGEEIKIANNTTGANAIFNVRSRNFVSSTNGGSVSVTNYLIKELANDWIRIEVEFQGGTGSSDDLEISMPNTGVMSVWGAQVTDWIRYVENPYIKTNGSIASVGGESASYANVTVPIDGSMSFEYPLGFIYLRNTVNGSFLFTHVSITGNLTLYVSNFHQSVTGFLLQNKPISSIVSGYSTGDQLKIAFTFKSGAWSLFVNGNKVQFDSGSETAQNSNFGFDFNAIDFSADLVKRVLCYDDRLTDLELKTLTE